MGIREDQFKLNSKLALPNYLQLKVWWKHGLWLETDHYLSLQGGVVRFCLRHGKFFWFPPEGSAMFSPPPIGNLLAVSFFIVSPLHYVGDDWSSLCSPWKPCDPPPPPPPKKKRKKPPPLPAGNKKWRASYIVKTMKQVLSFGFKRENLSFQLPNIMM